MDRLPQTPEEHARFDAYIRKWDGWARVVFGICPLIIFAPIWSWMSRAIGPEGAALIVIAAQLFLVLVVVDRALFALARRDMLRRRVRQSQI